METVIILKYFMIFINQRFSNYMYKRIENKGLLSYIICLGT